jgi:hypothetical protein
VYQAIINTTADPDPFSSQTDEEDLVLEPVWATHSSCSHDFLDNTLPSDEAILEAMNVLDRPWDDMHHHSYFLPELVRIEHDYFRSTLSEMVGHIVVPLDMHGIYVEGDMVNISPTIMVNISRIPGKIENVYIVEDCSPEEIQFYMIFSNNFVMYSLGCMERCQGLTPTLSNMRSKLIQMLDLFENILELLILGRPLLLTQR